MQGALALAKSRAFDYVALAKPELTLLSVLTAVCGAYLATTPATPSYGLLFHTFLGTLLVGGGAGILNQYWERQYDGMMRRTAHRPLPAGRVRPSEALILGCASAVLGVADLYHFTNHVAAELAVVTLATYLLLYTPLKRLTPYSTLIGGFPGALPPVIGWVAVRGELGLGAVSLFAILFFWQMPHFLSLAWMYRTDYARAGYRILTVHDPEGFKTAHHILGHSIGLAAVSFLPVIVGLVRPAYGALAAILAGFLIIMSLDLMKNRSNLSARRLFFATLVYLPSLLAALVICKIR